MEGLKRGDGKSIFKKLNQHSKELQAKQEDIAKKHNLLLVEHDKLENLKNNMNEYMRSDKTEKKESVIDAIKKKRVKNKEPLKENKKRLKEFER